MELAIADQRSGCRSPAAWPWCPSRILSGD